MKSKTSCFNKTIFLKNITHFWPIWLLIMGWNLFIMPFMIYNSSLQYKLTSGITEKELIQMKSNDILYIASVYMNPAILFIFSIIAAMAVFSYLYNARSANTIHALPVTRKELFLTNYISGLLFLIIPEAVGFLLGTLVGAVCGYTSINHLMTGFLLACGISFVFYSFAVFIAMFTGQLLAVPIFTVIINFLYIGCKSLVGLLMALLSYGITLEIPRGAADVLSPLYYMLGHVKLRYDYSGDYTICLGFTGKKIVACYALAALVFVIASYLIYRIRNMETAGSLISIPWIAPVFRWGAAFCSGTLFGILFSSIMGISNSRGAFLLALMTGLIFGAISFFGAQMFLEKGFRVFHKKRMAECGVFLLVFACLYVAIEVDLFGQERKIPDIDQVKSVSMDYYDSYDGAGITDKELIQEVMDIHKQIIDSKKEFEKYAESNYSTYYVSIRYNLKKGSLVRRYEIPMSREIIADSGTVIHRLMELESTPSVYRQKVFSVSEEDIKFQGGTINLYREDTEWSNYEFSAEDAKEIYHAFLADLEEGNFENCIYGRYDYDERIKTTYYNTINLDYTGKDETQDGNRGSMYSVSMIRNAGIEFDAECRHIIEALIQTGAIESEADLITIDEKTKIDEEAMNKAEYED